MVAAIHQCCERWVCRKIGRRVLFSLCIHLDLLGNTVQALYRSSAIVRCEVYVWESDKYISLR